MSCELIAQFETQVAMIQHLLPWLKPVCLAVCESSGSELTLVGRANTTAGAEVEVLLPGYHILSGNKGQLSDIFISLIAYKQ